MTSNRPLELQSRDSSSEEEDDSDSEEEEGSDSEPNTTINTITSPATPVHKKQPSASKGKTEDDDEHVESESDSDCDSDHVKSTQPDPADKPIASKPIDDPLKYSPKKPRSKPGAPASSSPGLAGAGLKRAAESGHKDSRRAKKKAIPEEDDNTVKKGTDDQKKQLFQRLWSEDDEIVILQGVLDYVAEKGKDPAHDMTGFHDFIRKSLHIDVSKAKLQDKVYRLKKKFTKQGNDRTSSKPHEQKALELSKKIWGADGKVLGIDRSAKKNSGSKAGKSEISPHFDGLGINGLKANGSVIKNSNSRAEKSEVLPQVDALSFPGEAMVEVKWEAKPTQSSRPRRDFGFHRGVGGVVLEEEILEAGLELIDGAKRVELEEKWKKLRVIEVELFLKRLELVREQTTLVLETMKSKEH